MGVEVEKQLQGEGGSEEEVGRLLQSDEVRRPFEKLRLADRLVGTGTVDLSGVRGNALPGLTVFSSRNAEDKILRGGGGVLAKKI